MRALRVDVHIQVLNNTSYIPPELMLVIKTPRYLGAITIVEYVPRFSTRLPASLLRTTTSMNEVKNVKADFKGKSALQRYLTLVLKHTLT